MDAHALALARKMLQHPLAMFFVTSSRCLHEEDSRRAGVEPGLPPSDLCRTFLAVAQSDHVCGSGAWALLF